MTARIEPAEAEWWSYQQAFAWLVSLDLDIVREMPIDPTKGDALDAAIWTAWATRDNPQPPRPRKARRPRSRDEIHDMAMQNDVAKYHRPGEPDFFKPRLSPEQVADAREAFWDAVVAGRIRTKPAELPSRVTMQTVQFLRKDVMDLWRPETGSKKRTGPGRPNGPTAGYEDKVRDQVNQLKRGIKRHFKDQNPKELTFTQMAKVLVGDKAANPMDWSQSTLQKALAGNHISLKQFGISILE